MYAQLVYDKAPISKLDKFHEIFFERYFNRLFQNYNEEIIFDGINKLRDIILTQALENLPPDDKNPSLNILRQSIDENFKYSDDYSDEILANMEQFDQVANKLMNNFNYLLKKGISSNIPEVLNQCFKAINRITFKLNLKKSGIYTQSFFYLNSANLIFDYTFLAYKRGVFIESHDASNILPSLFEELITTKHPVARTILQKYCHLLLRLQKLEKLDRWLLGGLTVSNVITLRGRLGEIAHKCTVDYQNGIEVKNCLDDCIEAFYSIKENFEKKPPQSLELYNVIKWQFEQIKESLEYYKIEDKEIMGKLNKYIYSFIDLKSLVSGKK